MDKVLPYIKPEQRTLQSMPTGCVQIATQDDLMMEVLQPPLSSVM